MKIIDCAEDCKRIQRVCLEKGYYGDLAECGEIWQQYSNDLCAESLFLPKTDVELWQQIEKYVIWRIIE